MDSSKLLGSIYHRFLATFVRRPSGLLVHCTGPSQQTIKSSWDRIQAHLSTSVPPKSGQPSSVVLALELETTSAPGYGDVPVLQRLVLIEQVRASTGDIIGIILSADDETYTAGSIETFFGSLILNALELDIQDQNFCDYGKKELTDTTETIVDHFDASLRYVGYEDKWDFGGREFFLDRVHHFTSRGKKIEFCLPAFPCKSSNPNKVQGTRPDRGEYISLKNLHKFVEGIERIYAPGAKLWIISDGHVFSDCIGVDDDVVDTYGAQLIAMNESIVRLQGGRDRVGFKSLVDIFALDKASTEIDIPEISHHISTKMVEESELCRRILMMGFQANGNELRERIRSEDPAVLALYRGFSRFMLEDLDLNVYTRDLSRSRRRKLSAKVAFEMIQRNQAYSNLVEVVFPHHVRLSIHAHSNSGPKFGIQLFGSGVRTTNILSPDGNLMESDDLLHVPTPWHNCVVEIQDHPILYVTKSSIAQSALSTGEFTGNLAGATNATGGYFHLTAASIPEQSNGSVTTADRGQTTLNKGSESEEGERKTGISHTTGFLHSILASLWNFAASCVTWNPVYVFNSLLKGTVKRGYRSVRAT